MNDKQLADLIEERDTLCDNLTETIALLIRHIDQAHRNQGDCRNWLHWQELMDSVRQRTLRASIDATEAIQLIKLWRLIERQTMPLRHQNTGGLKKKVA